VGVVGELHPPAPRLQTCS